MTQRVQRDLRHILDAFPPAPNLNGEPINIPSELLSGIQGCVDLYGTEKLATALSSNSTGLLNVSDTPGPTTPQGTMRYVLSAGMFTTSSAGFFMWLEMEHVSNAVRVPLSTRNFNLGGGAWTVPNSGPGILGLYLPPDTRLHARTNAVVGVGDSLFINMIFCDLEIGEYVTGGVGGS